AHDRPVHLGLDVDVGLDLAQARAERLGEGHRPRQEELLVVAPMGLEPVAVVVGAQPAQEAHRLLGETAEAHPVLALWPGFRGAETNRRASRASAIQVASDPSSAIHSFIARPCPGSNGTPTPAAISASTRGLGSLATNFPRASIAKIFPFAF